MNRSSEEDWVHDAAPPEVEQAMAGEAGVAAQPEAGEAVPGEIQASGAVEVLEVGSGYPAPGPGGWSWTFLTALS